LYSSFLIILSASSSLQCVQLIGNVAVHLNTLMMWCVCEPLFIGIRVAHYHRASILVFNTSLSWTRFDRDHHRRIFATTGVMCMWASVIFNSENLKTSGPQSQHLQWPARNVKTTNCGATICHSGMCSVTHPQSRSSPLLFLWAR